MRQKRELVLFWLSWFLSCISEIVFQKVSSFLINFLSVTLASAITILLYYNPIQGRAPLLHKKLFEVYPAKRKTRAIRWIIWNFYQRLIKALLRPPSSAPNSWHLHIDNGYVNIIMSMKITSKSTLIGRKYKKRKRQETSHPIKLV